MSNTRDNDTIHLESVQTTNYYQQRNEYEKIKPKQYVAKTLRETNEGKYWKQYKTCSVQNQPGIVTSVFYSGSPEDHLYPQYLTATSSARVTMYAQNGKKVLKTFARFKDVAFSGVFLIFARRFFIATADSLAFRRPGRTHRRPPFVRLHWRQHGRFFRRAS